MNTLLISSVIFSILVRIPLKILTHCEGFCPFPGTWSSTPPSGMKNLIIEIANYEFYKEAGRELWEMAFKPASSMGSIKNLRITVTYPLAVAALAIFQGRKI
uniref:Uncharacterized protein n=1 Tax=Glossina austeni TaxID=7395 RepID=A0A1A9UI16_GLOAU